MHIANSIKAAYPTVPPTEGPMTCVEIGSFEGRGSLIIADFLCTHPESKLYCIDPWEDCYTADVPQFKDLDHKFKGQLGRFQANTSKVAAIVPLRGTSDTMLGSIQGQVDFVYIDGDHSPDGVYKDGVNMLPKMAPGGVMVFDDYEWTHNGLRCRDGVDRFLKEYSDRVTLVKKGYQLIVRVL